MDHGIGDKVVNWISSWLSQRQQRVCINGEQSTWKPVWSGVPHGYVLGPVLFLIFINDIDLEIVNWIPVLKFTDDTKIFSKICNKTSSNTLQDDLTKLVQWSLDSQMEFNIQKCKVMHIGYSNPGYKYLMDNRYLQEISDEKDLGIIYERLEVSCTSRGSMQESQSSIRNDQPYN